MELILTILTLPFWSVHRCTLHLMQNLHIRSVNEQQHTFVSSCLACLNVCNFCQHCCYLEILTQQGRQICHRLQDLLEGAQGEQGRLCLGLNQMHLNSTSMLQTRNGLGLCPNPQTALTMLQRAMTFQATEHLQ